MKRVLLTGGAGFIGRHCVPFLLERGCELHIISRQYLDIPSVHVHAVDLMDTARTAEAVRAIRASHLLHLAWTTKPGHYATTTENFDWLTSSLSLIQSFHASGGKRVIVAGTCAEYDWTDGFCSEFTTPLNPVTFYGRCKLLLHSALKAFCQQTGLSYGWGRLFFIYGPYADPARMPGSVIASLLRNEPALCSHGNQIRDFLHVRDVASALVTLLDSDLQGAINIASGQQVTVRDLVQQIADRLGSRHLLQLGALKQPSNDPPRLVGNVQRLATELGWQPALTLAQGLDETVEWNRSTLEPLRKAA